MKRLVNIRNYFNLSLTQVVRYNDKLSVSLVDVNKVFTVTDDFRAEVNLNIFKTAYLDKFVRPKPEKYIEGFLELLKLTLFQAVVSYDLEDGHVFKFDFLLDGNVFSKEVRCYFIYKII